MRGTFANIRIKNQMVRDEAGNAVEGGFTIHQPSGERMFIYDAAMRYQAEGPARGLHRQGIRPARPATGRKGTNLLGIRAVIAESFERIHRSNLVGMGVVLVFEEGVSGSRSASRATRRSRSAASRAPQAAPEAHRRDHLGGRFGQERRARLPDRYARRAGIFPQRRHCTTSCGNWRRNGRCRAGAGDRPRRGPSGCIPPVAPLRPVV